MTVRLVVTEKMYATVWVSKERHKTYLAEVHCEGEAADEVSPVALAADAVACTLPGPGGHAARDGERRRELREGAYEAEVEEDEEGKPDNLGVSVSRLRLTNNKGPSCE